MPFWDTALGVGIVLFFLGTVAAGLKKQTIGELLYNLFAFLRGRRESAQMSNQEDFNELGGQKWSVGE